MEQPTADPSEPKLPLLESLKRDWSRGKLSSGKVLEYAQGAIQQGAQGIDVAGLGEHNAFRTLVNFFGTPSPHLLCNGSTFRPPGACEPLTHF